MSATNPQTIGLIGCGLMGHGIAKNLLKAGHRLTILDHAGNRPTDDLVSLGAQLAPALETVVSGQNVVMMVLPGSPEVKAVVNGANGAPGILSYLQPGTLVIDATTAEPPSTEAVAQAVRAKGCAFVDAPMTRTPKEAEEGRLNVLMGGSDEDVARAKDLIQAYAETLYHGGPVGAGHRLKLLHNFVSIGQAVVIAEAVAAARKGGVDLSVLTDVLATGGAGGVALERLRPFIESGDVGAFKFAIRNAAKDLGYYEGMAEHEGAARTTAHAVREVLDNALGAGGTTGANAERLMPELIDVLFES